MSTVPENVVGIVKEAFALYIGRSSSFLKAKPWA